MNLQAFSQDGIEIYIDTTTGEAFCSISGYARMVGKALSTVSERFKGVRFGDLKTAEVLTTGGLQGVRLIPAKLAFKWSLKDNPDLAEKMGEAGATVFLHKLAGYEVTSSAIAKTPLTYIEALEAHLKSVKEAELLKLEVKLLEEETVRLSEVVDELFDYSSIIRIAKYNGVPETTFKWRILKAASIKMGYEIKKVPCPRFVEKNLYAHDVWRLAYPGYKLPDTTTLVINHSDI
jgi:hypothetical protein